MHHVAGVLAGLVAIAAPPAGAAPFADLALVRESLRCEGRSVRAVVVNLGDAPSPAAKLELRDRSPLGGTTGGSSLYPFTPNQSGVWIFQEPEGKGIGLDIGLGAGVDGGAPAGAITIRGARGVRLESPTEGVRLVENVVRWDAPPPGGRWVRLQVAAARGKAPDAEIVLDVLGREEMPIFHGPSGDQAALRATLRLDALERRAAARAVADVPALRSGEQREISVRIPTAWSEAFAWVDPEDRVDEIREGNNVASWNAQRDRRTLAALHLHSSFSEGAGSLDWQMLHAAASGYDLCWWSEHDWRMACRDHVREIEFGESANEEDPFDLDSQGTTATARVDVAASGEGKGRALRLDVPPGAAGVAVTTISENRDRLTYSLAADLTLELRVFAEGLDGEDRFAVLCELSQHPGEKRRLEYSFRWEGEPPRHRDASDAVRRVVPRTTATGSWVTLVLPVSRDAAEAWPNGLDSNLQGLRLSVSSASSGASATVQWIRVRHESCGAPLRRTQEKWMQSYPNVAHQFADEVSFARPHLNQYGGPRGLFDFEEIWDESRVGDIVERVNRAGGLVSWCHPLGVRSSRRVRERFDKAYQDDLVQRRFGGTDVLEVGFRRKGVSSLGEYLGLWDAAGRRGVVITGIGVNDSHERDWSSFENNFGTWLAAPADDAARLRDALANGHAVFGDPLAFRGTLAISCGDAGPGDILGGSGPREVVARLEAAPRGTVVKLVVDGNVRREGTATRGEGSWSLRLRAEEARFVRAEAWSAAGDPLAFTNPIYFNTDGTLRR